MHFLFPFHLFPGKISQKRSLTAIRLLPTFDLEFYRYDFATFILQSQCENFLDGGFNVLSIRPLQK
nr:MAG TPA: hypothetical protein [Caudoviricetes sp.]